MAEDPQPFYKFAFEYLKLWDIIKKYDIDSVLKREMPNFSRHLQTKMVKAVKIREYFEQHSEKEIPDSAYLIRKYREYIKEVIRAFAKSQGYHLREVSVHKYKFKKIQPVIFKFPDLDSFDYGGYSRSAHQIHENGVNKRSSRTDDQSGRINRKDSCSQHKQDKLPEGDYRSSRDLRDSRFQSHTSLRRSDEKSDMPTIKKSGMRTDGHNMRNIRYSRSNSGNYSACDTRSDTRSDIRMDLEKESKSNRRRNRRSDGSRSDSRRSDGSKSNSSRSDGSRSNSSRSDGRSDSRSNSSRSNSRRSDSRRSDSSRSDGSRSDGSRSDGRSNSRRSENDTKTRKDKKDSGVRHLRQKEKDRRKSHHSNGQSRHVGFGTKHKASSSRHLYNIEDPSHSDRQLVSNGNRRHSSSRDKWHSSRQYREYSSPGDREYSSPGDREYSNSGDDKYSNSGDDKYSNSSDDKYLKSSDDKYLKSSDDKYSNSSDDKYSNSSDDKYSNSSDDIKCAITNDGDYESPKDSESIPSDENETNTNTEQHAEEYFSEIEERDSYNNDEFQKFSENFIKNQKISPTIEFNETQQLGETGITEKFEKTGIDQKLQETGKLERLSHLDGPQLDTPENSSVDQKIEK